MKAVVRAVLLGAVAVVLAQCGGTAGGLQGCTDIPERSIGACRVGLSPYSYYDDSWKSYP
jgi:hypothetical protein